MNATFGSAVEVILYIIFLVNGLKADNNCYVELVKSAMAGKLTYFSVNKSDLFDLDFAVSLR